MSPPDARPRLGVLQSLWSERNYRRLWVGQTLSIMGDSMIWVTAALYITTTTGSTRDVGIVLAAGSAALVLFLLVGGVWADRRPRQRIMIGSDLIRATVQTILAALIFAGEPPLWLFACLVAVFGAAEAFFQPAYAGLVPQTVPEELIQEAQGVAHTSHYVASFVGPGVATLIALHAGFGWVYAIDAGTFVLSAAMLARIVPRPRSSPDAAPAESMRHELVTGFHEVRSRAWVWVTLLMALIAVMAALGPFQALGATVARDTYHQISLFGWFQVASGIGAIIGAGAAVRWRPRHPLRTGTLWIFAWPASIAVYAMGPPVWVTLAAGLVSGFGSSTFLVHWETALAQRIPPNALSRVSSYDWMVSLGLLPVGFLGAGLLAERFDAATVLLCGAVAGMVAVAAGLLSSELRNLRRID
jgi:MFS family permease